ncbi:MAG: amidohydrolase family protein [Peptococcaceae bacterium]|nr:amidohydrolase family protein [Peptococcaceae bacterium]
MRKIIDFRVRVPYGEFLKAGFYSDIPKRTSVASGKYNMHLPQSVFEGSMERLIQEMDELNIVKAVVPARNAFNIPNKEMESLLEDYPGRFITFAQVSPLDGQKALDEIQRYVIEGKCTGVVVEPGYGPKNEKMAVNDERMYPIYDLCQKQDIPMMIGFGGMLHPSLKLFQPVDIDTVAEDFPNLRLLLAHGGWPYVQEMMWVALVRKNVWLMPDLYMYSTPGMVDYAMGANTVVKEKIIWGSAYPIVSQKESLNKYLNSGIYEEFLDNVLYKNALRFLKLSESEL